ncbi:polysaccharide transporter [filamentous cyanobacterium CCP1]|nr:polysaccharide transporter [filamentous cyanobacterium CCP2]PSB60688.1 polysaccharide transporter [filamentous cyanobacterium CCP1]
MSRYCLVRQFVQSKDSSLICPAQLVHSPICPEMTMRATVSHTQSAKSQTPLRANSACLSSTHSTYAGLVRTAFVHTGGTRSAFGVSIAVLVTFLSAIPGVAQVPTMPESPAESPVEIPVEPAESAEPAEPAEEIELNPLTDTPGSGTIQVPEIVPIPPRAAPTQPLSPAPGIREGVAPDEDTYVLGPGDEIALDIFDIPEFASTYTVLVDGSVVLPWIGRVRLQGLTLEQATALITREYVNRGFLVDPLITLNLLTPRTLTVSVVGEVRRPGAYSISPQGNASAPIAADTAGAAGDGATNQWPTVTRAIQSAGGITQLADLRNIQIRRALPDGSEQLVDVDLWELIRTGQLTQDITLRDRDTLVIPTATALNPDEAALIGSASFAPGVIRVNVVGEAVQPGVIEVPPNTSLNQAIQAAGGFNRQRARTSRVDLIRLNPNGTAVQRRIPIDLAAGINEETNPALRDGDTVVVGRSGLVSTTDFLQTVLTPVGAILAPFNILRDLFDND